MKRILFFAFLFSICSASVHATHNRAGEITYFHVGGNTYEFVVYTYTKTSAPADRPYLPISWGDGSPLDSLERESIIFDPTPPLQNVDDSQQNTYRKRHTFPGAGVYEICITDPNRNSGVLNIDNGNSVLVPFALKTTLRISAAIEQNNSVVFTNIPLQDACLFQPWVFNPGAVDPDGNDSLSYKLVPGMGTGCQSFELGYYVYPNQIGVDPIGPPSPNPIQELTIDPMTGTIIWEVPQRLGEYNLAILVEEWRDGILISTVLRDMQIQVRLCDNTPPELEAINDTCVEAGQFLDVELRARDNDGDDIQITGFGGPFAVPDSPAEVFQDGQIPEPGEDYVDAQFVWLTNCSHVQLSPYQAVIQATDNGAGPDLVDIETFNITVVAPAPENLVAEAVGSSIELNWDESPCDQATGYKIYRRINPFGFEPGPCETGVPEYTGYTLIANLDGLTNTTYLDSDEIIFGRENCYMVVACFEDGAESYASNEACAQIKFEIPIIKKNSVGITDVNGVDTVFWRSPIELDLDDFPGPYQYRLLRSEGYETADDLIFESEIVANIDDLETFWISEEPNTINTQDTAHTYRVELYSGGEFAARSNRASSLYIELTPDDNQMAINWREELPWLNFEYDIFRQTNGTGPFEFVGSTDTIGYVDTGLVNNREYCYYIVSKGSYFAVEESDTLINFSQRSCSQPYDRTPPCPPELFGEANCVEFTTDLEWTNPNLTCEETDDVVSYNLYFTPFEGGEFELIDQINGSETITWSEVFENSIAGCYYVTALDSISLRPNGEAFPNESDPSNIICFDNCPTYEFPNVFTPNADGRNDVFRPFPYRSVESVEFTVYNRWGHPVFTTTNPDINWDGVSTETGEVVSDATYFYTCKAFAIRLAGLDPIELSGYITVFADGRRTD